MPDSVDRSPRRATEARDEAIVAAMKRKRFREGWPELLRIIERNGGTPAGWTKPLALTTVLRKVSYAKILEEEWWAEGRPKEPLTFPPPKPGSPLEGAMARANRTRDRLRREQGIDKPSTGGLLEEHHGEP